jgi:hypothetical protein
MSKLIHGLLSAAAIAALVSIGTSAHALTYNYVETSGGSCCTVDSKNTVQVSDTTLPNGSTALAAGVFDVLVTLDTNWSFQKNDYTIPSHPAGASSLDGGHAASFLFSTSLTLTSLTVNTSPFFAEQSNPGPTGTSMSPWTSFPANVYGVSQNTSNSTVYSTLDFRVNTGTSDTLAQFIATLLAGTGSNYPNILFAADVQDGSTGPTGVIGFTFDSITIGGNQGGETPLPAALPLFASGLGALGLLGWRRKRKNSTARAAA